MPSYLEELPVQVVEKFTIPDKRPCVIKYLKVLAKYRQANVELLVSIAYEACVVKEWDLLESVVTVWADVIHHPQAPICPL